MKKVSLLLLTLLLFSCSNRTIDTSSSGILINLMNGKYSNILLDSMCTYDKLPKLEKWDKLYVKEYETKDNITIYVCSKNNSTYKVERINNDSVKITKRVIK